ncbi:IucA/IucC family protein [Marinobacterium aestuariivivens]|uniref:IucA/IucC family protein n=1 Tax=Marinobacterium aestuariivivens TaxID=1698799 RepID=A0ABW1ZYZ9_9GAMM
MSVDATGRYFLARVLDALLREDVQQLLSDGEERETLPADVPAAERDGPWWRASPAAGELWIPVRPAEFMQRWRYREGPVLARLAGSGSWLSLDDSAALIDWLGQGLEPDEREHYRCFARECEDAERQHRACRQARQDYFEGCRTAPPALEHWAQRFLHYDRLAAYLDHPYYPTARAKSGFDVEDLTRYAPEFGPRFRLRWLAVPRSLIRGRMPVCPTGGPVSNRSGWIRHLPTAMRWYRCTPSSGANSSRRCCATPGSRGR